jgi:hypothetical protein
MLITPASTSVVSGARVNSERAQDVWAAAVESPELKAVARALAGAGISVEQCVHEAACVAEPPETRHRLERIREAVMRSVDVPPGSFERFVLSHAALAYSERFDAAPVTDGVKRLGRSVLLRVADGRTVVSLSEFRFVALCKIATLRRFAAGQFDWEPSGLPRSWIPVVRPLSALARLMWIVACRWRGFHPAFFIHMGVAYPVHALLEREALSSYFRMARSMALQPQIKGLLASSWLHSPATFAISPHLTWLNRVFLENGALVATMGPASPHCGVLTRSVERTRAFAEGRFTPTLGLVVWPRREMLAWAARHPELER